MNSQNSIEWLNELENSLIKIAEFNNGYQRKLKNLVETINVNNPKLNCNDFSKQNVFVNSENMDSKEKCKILSSLDSVLNDSKSLLELNKTNYEKKQREFKCILKNMDTEVYAMQNINKFLNSWKENINDNLILNEYPKSFIECINYVKDDVQRNLLKQKVENIKPFPSVEDLENDTLNEKNQIFPDDTGRRLANISVLDYTCCLQDFSPCTMKEFGSDESHSLPSFNQQTEVEECVEEEDVVDPLNQAMIEEENEEGFLLSYMGDDSDDFPSIDTFDPCFGKYEKEVIDVSYGYELSNDRSIVDDAGPIDEEEGDGEAVIVPAGEGPAGEDSITDISHESIDYSFNKTVESDRDHDNIDCGVWTDPLP